MRAVLDACVLYPAALRDALLYPAVLGIYEPVWSPEIMGEVSRNLAKNGAASKAGATATCRGMDRAFPAASVAPPAGLVQGMPGHPKDRHVVAVAVAAGAPLIVTANLGDFPERDLSRIGVLAVHPDPFLCALVDFDPPGMAAAVRQHQAKLARPPVKMADMLATLANTVPDFVDLVRPLVV